MLKRSDFDYCLQLKVRDYECDMQGIVNNSVYQNYMEHTRHEFIQDLGLSFSDLCERGIDVVVARIEIAFKNSLRSKDVFDSCVSVSRQGIKYMFEQVIFNIATGQVVATGKVTAVSRINGKLSTCQEIDDALEAYQSKKEAE